MSVHAKCTNYAGCLRAYRGETITIESGQPLVCPECQKPLTREKAQVAGLVKLVPWAIIGAVLLAGALYFLKPKPAEEAKTAQPEVPAATPERFVPTQPAATTASTTSPVARTTQQPAPADAGALPPPKTSTAASQEEIKAVRLEVQKRIDLMPKLSDTNRDKLYNSVERARKMQKVAVVPFGFGQSAPSAAEVQTMKEKLSAGDVVKLRDDPTAVFVVLGYADTKGDPGRNQEISLRRAESVVKEMKDAAAVSNVTHAVAMGGQEIEGAQSADKNRIVEIWAVLP